MTHFVAPSSRRNMCYIVMISGFLLSTGRISAFLLPPGAVSSSRPWLLGTPPSHSPSTLSRLYAKLWDRLQIEEDVEPFWYLLNCVAGLELDLLRQCRTVCEDMPPTDVVKFVVPTEQKTRSHGAKKMVTETKVKYQGYVFAKLRLCPAVYEAIQGLDLCRSWMGTVNHKGHRKLPPAPIALSDEEVQSFGLEQVPDREEEEDGETNNGGGSTSDYIIVDTEDAELAESKIDKEAIKVYLGLKVDDMVKVTAKGKFFNEDGIVRRLKEGKIFVRFYTYGTMFEEWLNPNDVRKLSNMEILKGLSGPTRPVTQRDMDGGGGAPESGDRRRNFVPDYRGGPNQRNRRQDRTERRFRQDGFRNDEERGRNDRNWNWYQNQQQDSRTRSDYRDGGMGYQAGSRDSYNRGSNTYNNNNRSRPRDRGGDWAIGNVDSQWGRERRDTRRQNEMADAAIRGDDDWSAFVTPAGESTGKAKGSPRRDADKDNDDDDFFASLMSDLSSDLGRNKKEHKSFNKPSSGASSSGRDDDDGDDEDFFASLLSNVSDQAPPPNQNNPRRQRKQEQRSSTGTTSTNSQDDDFFAALEAELGSAASDDTFGSAASTLDDDLFTKLQAELSPEQDSSSVVRDNMKIDETTDEFFANLSSEDFFDNLNANVPVELDESKDTADTVIVPAQQAKEKAGPPKSSKSSHSVDLQQQTIPQLKEMLRERGLKVSGKKAELIDRLLQES